MSRAEPRDVASKLQRCDNVYFMTRPRSADPTGKTAADKVLALRVNTKQYKAIKKAASAAGMSVSAYIRMTVTETSSAA